MKLELILSHFCTKMSKYLRINRKNASDFFERGRAAKLQQHMLQKHKADSNMGP
jgi:hypothetical protein